MNKKFIKNLKLLRKENNKTQKQIGEIVDLSPTAIASWEQGLSEPSINSLILLANYFNCTIDELVSRNDYQGLLPADPQTHNEETMFKANKSKINYNYKKGK